MASIIKVDESQVSLRGELPDEEVLKCKEELEKIVMSNPSKILTIDFSQLETVNSKILSLMLCLVREAEKINCELSFLNMPQKLFDMARVGGVESFIPRLNN